MSDNDPNQHGSLTGAKLDSYEIGPLLGRGGMGDVYWGTDLQTGQTVAIKALRPEGMADDPKALARFRREGEVPRQLNHPNIVQMVDGLEMDGRPEREIAIAAAALSPDVVAAIQGRDRARDLWAMVEELLAEME
jgi:serine/threonine protein kinase